MKNYPIALLSLFTLTPISAALAQSGTPAQLPEVVVTGESPARETRQALEKEQALTPGGVTLVDGDALYERNVANVADMLRYVPGAWAAGSGSDAAFISIRGSNLDAADYDGNGVKLLQDGLPVTAADGNNHNRFVDPLSTRYAIVARGANALTYGASTLGGAIDFISPTALDSPPLELFFNAGSHGQRQARFTASGVADKFDGLVSVETKRRKGYRDHNEQQRESLYANGGWQLSDAVRTRMYLTHVKNDEELPGPLTRAEWHDNPSQAEAAAITGDYQWNVETWRLANKTTWEIDADSSLSLGFSYETQKLYHPIVQNPSYSLLIDTEQRNFGTSLRYNLHRGTHDLLVGLNYGRTEVKGGNYFHNGGVHDDLQTIVDNDADSTELFVMDRWQLASRWTAVYGAQSMLTSREVRNTSAATGVLINPKENYSSLNPRVGLIYQFMPQTELFANISRLYEAPTTYQLQDQVNGDRPLKAMKGTSLEVGTRGSQAIGTNQWRWDLAFYYATLRDEILSVDDPGSPGTSISTNVNKTVHTGIEALVGASFALDAARSHRIEPLVNLTVNHFHFDDDPIYGNNRLPAAPRYAVRAEMLYRHANGFFAGPTFDLVGKRYADFNNSYEVDSYTLWGLRAGYMSKNWEVYGEIRNLADKNYIARHSVRAIAAANAAILHSGEPRSVYVGVRTRF